LSTVDYLKYGLGCSILKHAGKRRNRHSLGLREREQRVPPERLAPRPPAQPCDTTYPRDRPQRRRIAADRMRWRAL
jgi:hypothetical protein